MTARQAAKALGVSVWTVYRRARAGLINAVKIAGRWLVTLDVARMIRDAVRTYRTRCTSIDNAELEAHGRARQAAVDALARLGQGQTIRDLYREGELRSQAYVSRTAHAQWTRLAAQLDTVAA